MTAGESVQGGDRRADGRRAARESVPEFIERFAALLITAGFPPMPARVFVALIVTDSGRLSSVELTELLQISPAAVSGAVRYLTGLGLVSKERMPGSRREYYRMPVDTWHRVMQMRNQVLARWTELLREGVDVVGGPGTAAGQRMTEQAEFFDFLSGELSSMLARWPGNTES